MDMVALQAFINAVGFPVFMSIVLVWAWWQVLQKIVASLDRLSDSIQQQTMLVQTLVRQHERDSRPVESVR